MGHFGNGTAAVVQGCRRGEVAADGREVRGFGGAEDVRWSRIVRLRGLIASGTYRVATSDVADSLMSYMLLEARR